MDWQIVQFSVNIGGGITVPLTHPQVSCIAQIQCASDPINGYSDDMYSRRHCWISFVDGTPPPPLPFDPILWRKLLDSQYIISHKPHR